MTEFLNFFNTYIIGYVGMLLLFYFYAKVLKVKASLPFYVLFTVCGGTITYFIPNGTTIGFGTLVLLLTAGGVFICHADVKSSLLYAEIMTEIMPLCYRIAESLMSALYPMLPAALWNVTDISLTTAIHITDFVLSVFCFYVVYRYFSCYTAMEIQHMFLVVIPILMIFIMSEYINAIGFSIEFMQSGESAGPLFSYWQLFAVHLLGLVSLFCILFAYEKMLQGFHLRTELSLLEQEEHSLNQYVEEAKARYEKTKSFRHDIKNHIVVIKDLLRVGKLEEAVSYIEDMDDMAEKMSFPCSTNHPVVDILAGNKLGIAKSMGINVSCSLLLPYPCGLRDIDLCIVLSNALDNAIHACKNMDAGLEKYIRVSGRMQGDFLMMEIENSFDGKGTCKQGTGLSNVKAVAEKYGGTMSIETQDNAFVLHVLLIIPEI